jgi:predicted NACHT family NTPase
VITGRVEAGGDVVGQNKIVNNHYYGERTEDPAEALKIYCQMVLRQCGDLPLRGLDIRESEAGNKEKAIGLAQVYVDLDTTSQVRLTKKEKEDERWRNRDTRPVTALEALQQNQKLVYLGDPGGGKSTFVSHLAYCLAAHHLYPTEKWLSHLPGWGENKKQLLPLLVILRDFAQFEPEKKLPADSPERLWQFIVSRLEAQGLDFVGPVLKKKLREGELLLLLDGLDEVTTPEQRLAVKQAVEGFMAVYAQNRYVLTCRILSYQAPDPGEKELRLTDLPNFTLDKFSPEKINQFITAWYTELAHHGTIENPGRKIEMLKEAVQRPDIQELAPNPLLLTIMALVHTHKGELPAARVLLYEDCIDMLLWKWEQKKGDNKPALQQWLERYQLAGTDIKQLLRRLAYEAHAQGTEGRGVVGIAEMSLLKELMKLTNKDANGALEMIALIKNRAGLLLERDTGVFTFPHRTFQEYMAGGHLANQTNFSKQADVLVTQNWGLWREAIKRWSQP